MESDRFPLIQLDLIQTATQQFSPKNKLGEGGFGPVYKVYHIVRYVIYTTVLYGKQALKSLVLKSKLLST